MRVLKILLTLYSLFIFGGISYLILFGDRETVGTPVALFVFSGIAIVTSVLNVFYHVKSFRFYQRKEKRQLDRKLPVILWIGTICFSLLLLCTAGDSMYNLIQMYRYGYAGRYLFSVLTFLVPGLLGFLEVLILKKRIKRLKAIVATKNEINEIGNQTE